MNTITAEKMYAGIDVGAEELILVLRSGTKSLPAQSFPNTSIGHKQLVKLFAKKPLDAVCLEATGVYSLDLSLTLHDAKIPLMVVNPMASHNFTKVLLKHSKTDNVDADTLAQYAQLMPFQQWVRPSDASMTLRAYSRRIYALTKQKAASKNQCHAMSFISTTPKSVMCDLTLAITQLEVRITNLTADAIDFIKANPDLYANFNLIVAMKGFGETSAVALLGELLMIPKGLTHSQWVKFAGLDPQHFRSGTSVEKKARLSKAGNHYIRAAMFMPAMSAKTHDPYVGAYFQHLMTLGKTPLQGVCAVMRKLLHALHGMLTNNQPFDNTRFYAMPTENIVANA